MSVCVLVRARVGARTRERVCAPAPRRSPRARAHARVYFGSVHTHTRTRAHTRTHMVRRASVGGCRVEWWSGGAAAAVVVVVGGARVVRVIADRRRQRRARASHPPLCRHRTSSDNALSPPARPSPSPRHLRPATAALAATPALRRPAGGGKSPPHTAGKGLNWRLCRRRPRRDARKTASTYTRP